MKNDFNLEFLTPLVLRTPAFSFKEYTAATMLPLQDPYFQLSIFISSPVFYKELEKKEWRNEMLSSKERHTLFKYWNRVCFRPTPFGLFAAVSNTMWSRDSEKIGLKGEKTIQVKYSFRQSVHLAEQTQKYHNSNDELVQLNTSLYRVQDSYRYLFFDQDPATGNRIFTIRSIEIEEVLLRLMTFCKVAHSIESLIDFMVAQFSVTVDESSLYLNALIVEQVFLNHWQPNISGEDYLSRIISSLPNATPILLQQQLTALDIEPQNGNDLPDLQVISISPLLLDDGKSPFFVNTSQAASGGLPDRFQSEIMDGINVLRQLKHSEPIPALQTFKEAFQKRFDQQMVPLLIALDPETGVSYDGMDRNWNSSPLLKGVKLTKSRKQTSSVKWNQVQSLLLRKYVATFQSGDPVLKLTDEDLTTLNKGVEQLPLPPSFSVMFRVSDNHLFIEQAGGATATSLIGRFTIMDHEVSRLAREIAEKEQEINPEVIFAEILHWGESHTANIEKRELIRQYEIPIITHSVLPVENQILLNELFIKMEGNTIILWSDKHQKRVIPRLSSAYNYTRASLSVFRFLCDLQHQDIQTSLNFRLEDYLPELDYYPRVTYRTTILSLATWKINEPELKLIFSHKYETDQKQGLIRLLIARDIKGHICLTEHDHQLVFNLDEFEDITFLIQNLKGRKTAVLKEFLSPSENSIVINDKGKPVVNQFIASVFNHEVVYKGATIRHLSTINPHVQQNFTPGSEWLYFKIYYHPSSANNLLTNQINAILEACGKDIKKWFFIRYNDPAFHLRLRFKVPTDRQGAVIQQIHALLDPLVQNGLAGNLLIDSYGRELERYPPEIIEVVETIFYSSSQVVLEHLTKVATDESSLEYYKVAFTTVHLMATVFYPGITRRELVFRHLQETMSKEFETNTNVKTMLRAKYRELNQNQIFSSHGLFNIEQADKQSKKIQQFIHGVKDLKKMIKTWNDVNCLSLFTSLSHMHLNRIFIEMPREQELIVYFCLSNYYYSLDKRSKVR